MATTGFGICLIISVLVILYMAGKNYENINTYYWSIVIILPIVILAYWLKSRAETPEAAYMAFCFIYLDSTVLMVIIIFSMLYSLGVRIKPWIKVLGYGAAFAHLGMLWSSFDNDRYYKSITVIQTKYGNVTKMESGPLKMVHLVYILVVFAIVLGIIIAGFVKHGTYSRRILGAYSFVTVIAIVLYGLEMIMDFDFSPLPYLYVLADLIIAFDYDHTHMHDIASLISEEQKYSSDKGYAAFDLKKRFLSCNEKIYEFLPELAAQRGDEILPEDSKLRDVFYNLIDQFDKDIDKKPSYKFNLGEMTCICEIHKFSVRKSGKPQGYLFDVRDATEEQKVLDVMNAYNETLNAEIKEKTENIVNIQQKVVVGMANIIENRDNNTGGHVKRTSDIISIIVDEIVKQGRIKMDEQFANDIVRAAPMHDLGKVTIDSYILCKPGKLTDEEYKIMKTHSTKSGEMVRILLDGVEEEHFVDVAFNVARYHHERWDGRGYPEGLVASMIPLEARIMAVADVYDALVSKRCYKEPMSFEKAREIMCEGMGTQFDPNMEKVFLGCREKLEEYYAAER